MENELIALNMLAGKGYSYDLLGKPSPSAFVGVLYTAFLYFHFLIFGKNYLFVELTQALLGSVSAVLLALIGKKLIKEQVGIFSGLIFAFYPIYVYWVTVAQKLILDIFLLEFSLYLVLISCEKDRFSWHFLAGVWMGLTALSKSFYLSFIALYWLWILLWKRLKFKKALLMGILWGFGALVAISPWTIRNYRVFGRFVPLTSSAGVNFWLGNNPEATGGLYSKEGKRILSLVPPNLMEKVKKAKDEAEVDEILGKAGWEWVKSHPKKFLKLIPLRLRALWWFDPEMKSKFPLLRKIVYVFLLGLALPGAFLSRKLWRNLLIFYLLAVWETVFYSFFFGQARFRYVIEFGFILFAGYFLCFLWQKLTTRFSSASFLTSKI